MDMDSSPQKSGDTSQEGLQSPKKETKTHWSALEPVVRTMKVAELREELDLRGIDSKGLKNALTQRLSEAIAKEKENEDKSEKEGTDGQEKQLEAVPEQLDLAAKESQSDVSKEQQQSKPDEPSPQKANEPSIMVKIKEEIVELMETDEAPEEKKESPEEQAKREKLEKERQELEKAKEKFEKEKKERKATVERHYSQIPKEPGIFVYPSKTAKNGKFECKLMSIHSLLDYRQDDIKESSFEVFLFVEALREAIDRSNAFVVYHSIATALDREAEKKRRNESLSEACKDEDVVVINEKGGEEKESTTKDGQNAEKQPKSPLSSTTDLRTNFKAVVHNLDLFTSFVHFDGNICGYLSDRDLEEIINSTGLDLSRGEVKNLVKKLASKERVNYRDLTDKWVDKEGNVKYIPEPTYQGSLFDSYKDLANGHSNLDVRTSATCIDVQDNVNSTNEASGIFFYEGKIVNIKQCIQQQTAMEEERQAVLDKNNELDLQLKSTKEQRDTLEKKKRRLEDDVDRYRKKLHDAEKNLKKEKEDNEMAKRSLIDCKRYGERIASIVEIVFPKPSKEPEVVKSNESIASGGGTNKEGKENKEKKENNNKETSGGGGEVVVLLDECKDESLKEGNQTQKDACDGIAEAVSDEMVVTEEGCEQGNDQKNSKQENVVDVKSTENQQQNSENKEGEEEKNTTTNNSGS